MYEPNHGYGIMQFIENETNGRLILGSGTLYGAINTLLKKDWIAPYELNTDTRKKQYIIIEHGKMSVNTEIQRIEELLNISKKIVERG